MKTDQSVQSTESIIDFKPNYSKLNKKKFQYIIGLNHDLIIKYCTDKKHMLTNSLNVYDHLFDLIKHLSANFSQPNQIYSIELNGIRLSNHLIHSLLKLKHFLPNLNVC